MSRCTSGITYAKAAQFRLPRQEADSSPTAARQRADSGPTDALPPAVSPVFPATLDKGVQPVAPQPASYAPPCADSQSLALFHRTTQTKAVHAPVDRGARLMYGLCMARFLTPFSTLLHRLFPKGDNQPPRDEAVDDAVDEAAWLASWPRYDLPAAALSFTSPPYMILKDNAGNSLSFHGEGLFGALLIVMALEPEPGADWRDADTAMRKMMAFVDDEADSGYQFLESGPLDAPHGGTWMAGSYGADGKRLALGFVHALIPTEASALLINFVDMGILDARDEGIATITAIARSIGPLSVTT